MSERRSRPDVVTPAPSEGRQPAPRPPRPGRACPLSRPSCSRPSCSRRLLSAAWRLRCVGRPGRGPFAPARRPSTPGSSSAWPSWRAWPASSRWSCCATCCGRSTRLPARAHASRCSTARRARTRAATASPAWATSAPSRRGCGSGCRPARSRRGRSRSCSSTSTTSRSSTTTRATPPATRLLQAMAAAMRSVTRPGDQLFRIGGDEFAMLLPDTDVDDALEPMPSACCTSPGARRRARGPAPSRRGISAVPLFGRDPRAALPAGGRGALLGQAARPRRRRRLRAGARPAAGHRVEDATRGAIQEVLIGPTPDARLPAHRRPAHRPHPRLRGPHPARSVGAAARHRASSSRPPPPSAARRAGRGLHRAGAAGRHAPSAPDRLLTLNLSPRTLEVRDFDAGWLLQGLYRNGISPGSRHRGAHRARRDRRPGPPARRRSSTCRQYGAAPRGRRRGRRQRRPAPALAGPVRHRQARPLARPGRRPAHGRAVRPAVAPRPGARPARPRRGRGRRDGRAAARPPRAPDRRRARATCWADRAPRWRATFVDVDTLGGSDRVARRRRGGRRVSPQRGVELRRTGDGDGPAGTDGARGRDLRAIILPAPRLSGLVELARRRRPPDRVEPSGRLLRPTRKPVPPPSWSARCRAPSARPSAMTARSAREPGPSARRAERTLGTMPPAMTPSAMSRSASSGRELRDALPIRAAHAVRVGQQQQLAAQRGADRGRGVVGVDVADASLGGPRPIGATTGRQPAARSASSSAGVGRRLGDDEAEASGTRAVDRCGRRCRAHRPRPLPGPAARPSARR